LLLQGTRPQRVIIGILLDEGELRRGAWLGRQDLFVLGKFRFTADSTVCGIIGVCPA
jgi:hypothetical protein